MLFHISCFLGCRRETGQGLLLPDGWRLKLLASWDYDRESPDCTLVLLGPSGQREETEALAVERLDESYDDLLQGRFLFGWFQSSSGRFLALTSPGKPRTILAIVDLQTHTLWPSQRLPTPKSVRELKNAEREIRKTLGDCTLELGWNLEELLLSDFPIDYAPHEMNPPDSGGSTPAEDEIFGGDGE